MSLAIISLLLLVSLLRVHGDIFLYNNTSFIFYRMYQDILSPSGPGLPIPGIEGFLREADPPLGCTPIKVADRDHLFVIIRRGNCTFEAKVRMAQAAKYAAVIVYNEGSNDLIRMPYDNNTGIFIPAVFVGEETGIELIYNSNLSGTFVTINDTFYISRDVLFAFCMFVFVAFFCMLGSICYRYVSNRRRRRINLLPASVLKSIPKQKYDKSLIYETCVICQENFNVGDIIRILPCSHAYHAKCIDVWLTQYRRVCAVCKRRVLAPGETWRDEDEDSEAAPDDRTPLLGAASTTSLDRPAWLVRVLNLDRLMERLRRTETLHVSADDDQIASSSHDPRSDLLHSVNAAPDEYESDTSSSMSSTSTSLHYGEIGSTDDVTSNQETPDTAAHSQTHHSSNADPNDDHSFIL